MSDWGICRDNLDTLQRMNSESPLTDRELRIAEMQFNYSSTDYYQDKDFEDHPVMKMIAEQ